MFFGVFFYEPRRATPNDQAKASALEQRQDLRRELQRRRIDTKAGDGTKGLVTQIPFFLESGCC